MLVAATVIPRESGDSEDSVAAVQNLAGFRQPYHLPLMNTDTRTLNPFPGLRAFREDEDYLFFGREDQTIELLSRLGSQRFVAVVGTSGSGKSSLVRCGLLSQLQGGKMLQAGT